MSNLPPSLNPCASGSFPSITIQDINLEKSRISWLDYFIPNVDRQDRHRSRLLVAGCVAVILFALPLALVDMVQEGYASPTVFAFVVGAILMVANLWLLRRSVSHKLVGKIAALEILAALSVMSFYNGGLGSASFIWSMLVPVLAGVWVGPRFAGVCAIGLAGQVVAFYLFERSGYVFPQALSDSVMHWWRAAGLVTVALFLWALVWIYETNMLGAMRAQTSAIKGWQGALESLQRDFNQVIDKLPDAVLVFQGSTVNYANPTCVAQFELEGQCMDGIDLLSLVSPEEKQNLKQYLDGQKTDDGNQFSFRRGELFVELSEVIPVHFGGQEMQLVVARDVTERRAMQSQLIFADRMATIGELVASVSHEINNPLTYILSNLELASEELNRVTDHAEVLEFVNDALLGTSQICNIVRDLKRFSHSGGSDTLSAGTMVAVDVRLSLQSAQNMANGKIKVISRIEQDFADDLPMVLGDEGRLTQVFLNLLLNAAQAFDSGTYANNLIRIKARTNSDGQICIEVSDNGCGIEASVMPRIFEPFYTTKEIGIGSGLGLPICHGIVTATGGRIEVESIVGQGTTFQVVLLPAAPDERAQATDTDAARAHGSVPDSSIRNRDFPQYGQPSIGPSDVQTR